MNKLKIRLFMLILSFSVLTFTSCKNKSKDNSGSSTTTMSDTSVTTSPVITGDEDLKKGVMDATKDYPGVKADVSDGVINLSGEINRADWQRLNPTLNSLHPKRVNSTNLTIK